MYLGVVGRPKTVGGRHFNGRILMERVSRTKKVSKLTKHTRFLTDALVNHEIKLGSWRKYHSPGVTTVDAMVEHMVGGFQLDNEVGDRLKFHYEDWTQGSKKTKK